MEDGIKDKQELLDTLLAVCIGCQDYVFKTITDKMDYAALIKDASMYFNNNVRILDSNGDRVTLLPMVTDAETVEVTKEAFIASVESIKELLVVTNFTIAANLLLDLLGGINTVEDFKIHLKRLVGDTLFTNEIVTEMIVRSLDGRGK